jgi:hypothetical protein
MVAAVIRRAARIWVGTRDEFGEWVSPGGAKGWRFGSSEPVVAVSGRDADAGDLLPRRLSGAQGGQSYHTGISYRHIIPAYHTGISYRHIIPAAVKIDPPTMPLAGVTGTANGWCALLP